MYTGYLICIASAIAIITNVFMVFHLDNWSEIPFFDMNGDMHKIKLATGGLFFLTLLKIIGAFITLRWGKDAVNTFKPIVKEVEHEELHGVCQEIKAFSNERSVKAHRSKVVKYLLWSFALVAITIVYGRKFFVDVANRFIDDEYDAYEARNQTQNNTDPYFPNYENNTIPEEEDQPVDPIAPIGPEVFNQTLNQVLSFVSTLE
jgi:hypothetical protein